MTSDPLNGDQSVSSHRLRLGALIFVCGQLAPLLIPLVAMTSLPATWKTGISAVLLFGIPELAILLTVVVMGKAGFDELKARIWKIVHRTVRAGEVSRGRYYFGLVLFLIPMLIGWISPYLYESMPRLAPYRLTIAIVGDAALIVGLCLLGGQFWDKLRALLVYNAHVTFPPADGRQEPHHPAQSKTI